MSLVTAAAARRTKTPNATMVTLASPTQGGAESLSMWRVEMAAGARGPLHAFDAEQLWTVIAGTVTITVDGEAADLHAGDTLVVPAGAVRQVLASAPAQLVVCGRGTAIVSVPGEDAPRGTPPWIA
jgi:quercetin dioxygenase-like cupin family protein